MNTSNIIKVDMSTDKRELRISAYYQYDRGLLIQLVNVPENRDYDLRLEMCNAGDKVIEHVAPYSENGVEVPADLLLDGRNVQIFVFAVGEDWGKTILTVDMNVSRRPGR